ncbi:MAG: hypothetical protein SFX73_37775 [Kofleriaceae bacterium]|nr:hypothetical protein [Kofleriaceae bacterium]
MSIDAIYGERFAHPFVSAPPGKPYTLVATTRWSGVGDILRIHELAERNDMRVVSLEVVDEGVVVDVTCDVSPSS